MKKIVFFIMSSFLLCAYSFAQVPILTFTAKDTNGFYICLDRVIINNLTKDWTETIYYPDTVLIMGASGIGDAETNSQFSLFRNVPNPFAGVSEFSLQLIKSQKVTISVFDAEGRKITATEKSLLPGEHAFRLLLSTPQTYLLHVRAGTEQASLTVINTGNAGTNCIEYLQSSRSPLKISPLKTNKGQIDNPFDLGDEMEYIGYTIINDTEYESEHIQQQQLISESFELLFAVYAIPTVVTTEISDITDTSATSGGDVTFDGNSPVTARGICWSTNPNPTISDAHTFDGNGLGVFTSSLTGLMANTTYYVCAYATNSVGTAYGQPNFFTTFDLPMVTTTAISDITDVTAISGGDVTFDGNDIVTNRGVCWSINPNPTIADSLTSDGNGLGVFTSSLTGLMANTNYYVRAYATNSVGTAYGNAISFTTFDIPTVTTTAITNITVTTATSGGNVTSDGNLLVTTRGVCWSTSHSPTISDSHTSDGSGTGTFISSLTGLSGNTTYFVCAYATNSVGTAYGNAISFTTFALPTVITATIADITSTSATSGGEVTSDGNSTVTAYGVCWSTNPNPTITDSHTSDGSGTGTFTSSLTLLMANTTYYVCAYAINSFGTSYGQAITFTTFDLPIVTTSIISTITQTSAISGGTITFDGNTIVTARGVCWSTNPNPTITDSHTSDGSGTGTFTSSLTSLTANTTYYVCAYAINSVGIAYGTAISFTTFDLPTVTTSAISAITYATAISGGDVTFDGNTSVTIRGVCWSTNPNPTIADSYTSDGSGTGTFTSSITSLTANTTYYVCAYATNSVGTAYGNAISFTTLPPPCTAGVTDIDGNHYDGVEIGTQCWMKENLRVTQYADGTSIVLGTSTSTSVAYRYNPNNNANNVSTYGYLYNWKAVMYNSSSSTSNPSGVQGVCPIGWHVPSNTEWIQLTNYVSNQSAYLCNSNSSYIAKALASTSGWNSHTGTCTVGNDPSSNNATGFGIVPAGLYSGSYTSFASLAFLWSATENNATTAGNRSLYNSNAEVLAGNIDKFRGYSVRCLRN